jgi:protein SCO1/2
MTRLRALFALLLLALFAAPGVALAQDPHGRQHDLDQVSFEQKLGAQVPLDLTFVDEAGATVRLGDFFGTKPVVMVLSYFQCPMLCPLVRDGMVKATSEMQGLKAGSDFQVINVSIDPADTPMNAANTKAATMSRLGQSGAEQGWHFLTGTQDNIKQLADSVGFHYFYDETINQYAHAAGILVLTPGGELARYFYGIEYNPSDLRLGLVEASGDKIGSPVDQLLLLCYHFDPSTGKYTGLVMTALRIAAVTTVLGLMAAVALLSRRSGRSGPPPGSAPLAS